MSARIAYPGFAAALLAGSIAAYGASPPNVMDLPPANIIPAPVEITPQAVAPDRPPERPAERAAPEASGNPLWAIPLSALTATRDRPIFVPSRRAAAPALAGPPPVQRPVAVAAPPPEADRPQLVLVGVIANGEDGFAVFLDQTSSNVVRLRTGQDHSGWVLRSVKGREAVLQKGRETATMVLPVPGKEGPYPAPEGAPVPPGAPMAPPRGAPYLPPGPAATGPRNTPGWQGLVTVPTGAPINPRTGEPEL
jgi:hypothetical protein